MNKLVQILLVLFACISFQVTMADAKDLTHEAFAELRSKNPESILLDVRTTKEYADGFIKGAINTPHTDTKKILASVSKDDTIILYCRSGRRVGIVAEMLSKKGYQNIYHLDGDIKEWIAKGKPLEKP